MAHAPGHWAWVVEQASSILLHDQASLRMACLHHYYGNAAAPWNETDPGPSSVVALLEFMCACAQGLYATDIGAIPAADAKATAILNRAMSALRTQEVHELEYDRLTATQARTILDRLDAHARQLYQTVPAALRRFYDDASSESRHRYDGTEIQGALNFIDSLMTNLGNARQNCHADSDWALTTGFATFYAILAFVNTDQMFERLNTIDWRCGFLLLEEPEIITGGLNLEPLLLAADRARWCGEFVGTEFAPFTLSETMRFLAFTVDAHQRLERAEQRSPPSSRHPSSRHPSSRRQLYQSQRLVLKTLVDDTESARLITDNTPSAMHQMLRSAKLTEGQFEYFSIMIDMRRAMHREIEAMLQPNAPPRQDHDKHDLVQLMGYLAVLCKQLQLGEHEYPTIFLARPLPPPPAVPHSDPFEDMSSGPNAGVPPSRRDRIRARMAEASGALHRRKISDLFKTIRRHD